MLERSTEDLAPGFYWVRVRGKGTRIVAEFYNGQWAAPGLAVKFPANTYAVVSGPIEPPPWEGSATPNVPPTVDVELRVWLDDQFRQLHSRLDQVTRNGLCQRASSPDFPVPDKRQTTTIHGLKLPANRDLNDPACAGAGIYYVTCPRCGATSVEACLDPQAQEFQSRASRAES